MRSTLQWFKHNTVIKESWKLKFELDTDSKRIRTKGFLDGLKNQFGYKSIIIKFN